jgi:hypothetical protein
MGQAESREGAQDGATASDQGGDLLSALALGSCTTPCNGERAGGEAILRPAESEAGPRGRCQAALARPAG